MILKMKKKLAMWTQIEQKDEMDTYVSPILSINETWNDEQRLKEKQPKSSATKTNFKTANRKKNKQSKS